MFESLSTSTFSASTESIATSLQPSLQPSLPPLSEVAPTSYEGSANSHPPLWEPTEPQYCKAIADHYDVSRKSVQEWFQKVKEACPWFDLSDLKLEDDRYTPLCIGLMGRYRTSGLPFKVWKTQIWEENTELVAAFQNSYQPTDPVSDRSYFPPSIAPPQVPSCPQALVI